MTDKNDDNYSTSDLLQNLAIVEDATQQLLQPHIEKMVDDIILKAEIARRKRIYHEMLMAAVTFLLSESYLFGETDDDQA